MPPERADEGGYAKLSGGDTQHQQKAGSSSPLGDGEGEAKRSTPLLLWPIFCGSLLAGSTSGPIMKMLQGVGPFSMAGWRHQVSAVFMLPGFIYQATRMSKLERKKALRPLNLVLHFMSSAALAGHFATYSWSIYHTSVLHCLFILNTSPVFATLWVKLQGGKLRHVEYMGVCLTLAGTGLLAIGSKTEDDETSRLGDAVAVAGAVFGAAYLMLGKALRTNAALPLFVYQFPVAFGAAVLLGAVGLLTEGWNVSDEGLRSGLFGWLCNDYWLQVMYLGLGPGFLGHAGYSYVLKYASPLVMPTGLTSTAFIGSFLSWLLGQTPVPGVWTCFGAMSTLAGTMLVSIASNLPKAEAKPEDCQWKPASNPLAIDGLEDQLLPPQSSPGETSSKSNQLD